MENISIAKSHRPIPSFLKQLSTTAQYNTKNPLSIHTFPIPNNSDLAVCMNDFQPFIWLAAIFARSGTLFDECLAFIMQTLSETIKIASIQPTGTNMVQQSLVGKYYLNSVPGLAAVGVLHGDGDGPRAPPWCLESQKKVSND